MTRLPGVPVPADKAAPRLAAARRSAHAQIAALTDDLARLVDASVDANADDEHDPEGATIAFERAQLAALLARAEAQLAELDAAGARVAAGSYGRCESCGDAIAPERLVARPAARTCVHCAGSPTGNA